MIGLFRTMLLRPRRVPCPVCCGTGVIRRYGGRGPEPQDDDCFACRGRGRLSKVEARCWHSARRRRSRE